MQTVLLFMFIFRFHNVPIQMSKDIFNSLIVMNDELLEERTVALSSWHSAVKVEVLLIGPIVGVHEFFWMHCQTNGLAERGRLTKSNKRCTEANC